MAKQVINIGTTANDGTGDTLRNSMSKANSNFTELYGATGWQSRVDTTNTQTIPATTITAIPITIGLESNGGLTLLDSNSKITPIALGDFLVVNFAFTAVSPSGADHYCNILFRVNGVTYRSVTEPYLKGTGVDDDMTLSIGLPVGTDFLTYGGQFFIYSDVSVVIKNRYIAVSRTHKAL